MNEFPICQSCGMPLETPEQMGTESDGSITRKYCAYCYQNGAFTNDITLDEMIESNLKYLKEWNKETGEDFTLTQQEKSYKPIFLHLNAGKINFYNIEKAQK